MGNQFSGENGKVIIRKVITIWDECRTLCEGTKELGNAVEALETELDRLETADNFDKWFSVNDEILAFSCDCQAHSASLIKDFYFLKGTSEN